MNDDITIENRLGAGHILILDLISQIDCLVSEIDTSKNNERSITSSIIIMSFAILEAYVNFISDLIIQGNSKENSSPSIIYRLNIIELDVLKEQSSYFDNEKCEVKQKNNSYLPILKKLEVTTKLLAKSYGKNVTFNKGGTEWQYIKELKNKRDDITHPKFNSKDIPQYMKVCGDLKKMNPAFHISPEAVLHGLEGIRWYLKINGELLISIFKGKINSFTLNAIDLILYKTILKVNKVYSIKKHSSFEKSLLKPMTFEESFDENLVNILAFCTSGLNQ